GGHIEFFKYMLDLLRSRGGEHVKVFGGGGGVIVPAEIKELQDYGVARIYSPEDGQRMGLQGMINDMLARCDFDPAQHAPKELKKGDLRALARTITALESGASKTKDSLHKEKTGVPVLGVTGTGGAGKSSLTDELVRRFRLDQGDALRIAVLSVDPTRRKTGGALLGDRIRMNAIHQPGLFMRSFATREVRKQVQRNRQVFGTSAEQMPVFGTIASRFNDDGVTALYHAVAARLAEKGLKLQPGRLPRLDTKVPSDVHVIIPPKRQRYLAEIAETVRAYHQFAFEQSTIARERQQLAATRAMLGKELPEIQSLLAERSLDADAKALLDSWPETLKTYSGDEQVVKVRGREIRTALGSASLSGTRVPKVALPKFEDHGELLRWRLRENLPGEFPF